MKTIILSLVSGLFSFVLWAQSPVARNNSEGIGQKEKVFHYLKRTNVAIMHAQKAVKKGGVYTGDLSRAVAHQQVAIKMYKQDQLKKAIAHSKLAREHAFKAMEANHINRQAGLEFSAEESALHEGIANNAVLEKEMISETKGFKADDQKMAEENLSELEVLEMPKQEYKAP